MASRRWGRYLRPDSRGRPQLDAAKVKAATKFDGKWVVITNDEKTTAEDVALAYKGGAIIEFCFRRMKQTGLEVRPMFHWRARRIEAHIKLCVLALQMQRTAEIRTGLPWARIAHLLAGLKAVRYRSESRTIVQRTKIAGELAHLLKSSGFHSPSSSWRRPGGRNPRPGIDTRPESVLCKPLPRFADSARRSATNSARRAPAKIPRPQTSARRTKLEADLTQTPRQTHSKSGQQSEVEHRRRLHPRCGSDKWAHAKSRG